MSTVTDLGPSDESTAVRWEGTLQSRDTATDVVVETADGCVLFHSESGQQGVVPREHVSAVESEVVTRTEYDVEDYRLIVGGGAGLAVLAVAGGVLASSGLVSLVFVLLACGGLWAVEYGWSNRDRYDGFERTESELERVRIYTDAGTRREFLVPAEFGAGEELGRFVRSS